MNRPREAAPAIFLPDPVRTIYFRAGARSSGPVTHQIAAGLLAARRELRPTEPRQLELTEWRTR